jgi:hypothetical protein
MRRYLRLAIAVLIVLLFSGINAHAKKPAVTRHDGQYLDKAVKISVQWQSTEPIVSIKIAAGKGEKVIKVDPYSNKRNPDGYQGEEDIVLETEPAASQAAIPYSIQLEDEDGQRSNLVTGQVKIPAAAGAATGVAAATPQEDQWGKEKLAGTSGTSSAGGTSGTGDIVDKLRQVAQTLASPPVVHDLTVNNPGSNTVTFKTKATHSVGLQAVKFRVFSADNKQVDSQDIEAKGTVWEGTSKDFTLPAGKYFVIAQAVDAAGNTSPEKKTNFAITGTAQVQLPQPEQPQPQQPQADQTQAQPEQPQVDQPQQPQADQPQPQPEQPQAEQPQPQQPQSDRSQQNLPSISDPVVYFNGNIAGVQNNPARETAFAVDAKHQVTFIYTYHYFNKGKKPGTIALRHSDGTIYGPWQADGALGQGGVRNAYWFVMPNVEIKPGQYTVIDSDRDTWSHNGGSSGAGFAEIRGMKIGR